MSIDSTGAATAAPAPPARPPEKSTAKTETAALQGTGHAASTTAAHSAVKGAEQEPTHDQMTQAVSKMNKSEQAQAQGLEFSIDKDSKRTVVKVVDQVTKEVLRQIPSVEALQIAKSLDSSKSLMIKQTA